jgi:hypothetical protein
VGDERAFRAPAEPFPNQLLDQAATPTYDPAARYALREGLELALLLLLGRVSTPPGAANTPPHIQFIPNRALS